MAPVPWTARSPDLTSLGYYLWGSKKSRVYGTPVTSEEDLIARVHGAIECLTRQLRLLGVKLSTADVGGSAMT